MKKNRLNQVLMMALSGAFLAVHNAILRAPGEVLITSTAGEGVAVSVAGAAVNATTQPAYLITSANCPDGFRKAVTYNYSGEVEVKLRAATAGTINPGTLLVLHSDGTFQADPGTGARVVCARAIESKITDSEFCRAILIPPVTLA
jgi:hypothetical protein